MDELDGVHGEIASIEELTVIDCIRRRCYHPSHDRCTIKFGAHDLFWEIWAKTLRTAGLPGAVNGRTPPVSLRGE